LALEQIMLTGKAIADEIEESSDPRRSPEVRVGQDR
jgi:hypothetical protein